MRIETNAANRKDVVKAVSGILGQLSKYMGVPTCAYQIGNCTIDKSGAVETEDEKTAELVREGLAEQGFLGSPEPEAGEATVSLPMEGMTAEGLETSFTLPIASSTLLTAHFWQRFSRFRQHWWRNLAAQIFPIRTHSCRFSRNMNAKA